MHFGKYSVGLVGFDDHQNRVKARWQFGDGRLEVQLGKFESGYRSDTAHVVIVLERLRKGAFGGQRGGKECVPVPAHAGAEELAAPRSEGVGQSVVLEPVCLDDCGKRYCPCYVRLAFLWLKKD